MGLCSGLSLGSASRLAWVCPGRSFFASCILDSFFCGFFDDNMSQEGDSSRALLPPAAGEPKSDGNSAPGGAAKPEGAVGAAAAALGGAAKPEDVDSAAGSPPPATPMMDPVSAQRFLESMATALRQQQQVTAAVVQQLQQQQQHSAVRGLSMRARTSDFVFGDQPLQPPYRPEDLARLLGAVEDWCEVHRISHILERDGDGFTAPQPDELDLYAHLVAGVRSVLQKSPSSGLLRGKHPRQMIQIVLEEKKSAAVLELNRLYRDMLSLSVGGSVGIANSEDLFNRFSDLRRAMQQVRVLVAARTLGAEAEREVARWEDLHHLVMYLEALKSHPSYSHIAAQLEGSPAFCDGSMTLEDARRSVATVVVGPPAAEQQALASAADVRAAAAFRNQWMRGHAGAGGPGGGLGRRWGA